MVGDGGLEYHCVNTNLTSVVMAVHDVVEHVYSTIPHIFLGTYAFLAKLRLPKVTRFVISKWSV